MPKDIEFTSEISGIEEVVNEILGVETFGNLTMKSADGVIGNVSFDFVSQLSRGNKSYVLRHSTYKRDDLFALYLLQDDIPALIGIADVNFEEELVSKLIGIGIRDEFKGQGHGTAFLASIERECAKSNLFLLLHNPLFPIIPFYVGHGYRYLEYPDGSGFAKVLNPKFDERLLMP